jgi:hypothetical protein
MWGRSYVTNMGRNTDYRLGVDAKADAMSETIDGVLAAPHLPVCVSAAWRIPSRD